MAQGCIVVENAGTTGEIIVAVEGDVVFKAGKSHEVRVESDHVIQVTRHPRTGRPRVTDAPTAGHTIASGPGSVAIGGSNKGIISTGSGSVIVSHSNNQDELVTDTSKPVVGTTIWLPAGTKVDLQIADTYTVDDEATGKITVIDNR